MRIVGPSVIGLVVLLAGCEQFAALTTPPEGGSRRDQLPPVEVNLPPVPNLDLVDVPAVYDDGSYSISGLMLRRDEHRGQWIPVTGILQTVYECEEAARGVEGEVADMAAPIADQAQFDPILPGCLRPHLYLVDNLRARQRLLVTGYDHSWFEPQLTPGQRYVMRGRYEQQTRGFISTEDGLLVAEEIEGTGVSPRVVEEADAPE